MARRDRDEWDEGLDPEGPSAEDLDRFGDEFVRCGSCGREVYDQAEVCPRCGGPVAGPGRATPGWIAWAAVAVLAAFVLGIAGWRLF